MFDEQLLDRLRSEVVRGTVSMRGSYEDYCIFKYSQNCVIDDAWNGTNRQARGIIFYAPTGRIVCRPFDKFFNLDERQETKLESLPDSSFIIWEKLDGSCCSSFNMWGEICISTPGSYESEQAVWATKWLREYLDSINKKKEFFELNTNMTFIFEGIWPEEAGNPASPVLNYGDRQELVLLSIRKHNGLELSPPKVDLYAEEFGFTRPKRYDSSVNPLSREMKDAIPDNEEGYVIQYPGNKHFRVKVKSPTYMLLHRTRDKISYKGLCEIMEGGESRRWIESLPKHMTRRADDILAELNQEYYSIFYAVEDKFKEARVLKKRKEQALYILGSDLPKSYTGLVFAMLDDKFNDRLIWGILKKEKRFQSVEID